MAAAPTPVRYSLHCRMSYTYSGAAYDFGMTHILCTKHFSKEIVKNGSGLGALAREFQVECSSFIYTCMSVEALDTGLANAMEKYSASPSAMKSIQSIWRHRAKVCRAYTGTIVSS